MKLSISKGSTSVKLRVFISDSSSTTGAGLTGLTYTSSGLKWYYWRDDTGDAGGTAITVVTATRGTWTSGGFKEIDATNMPGWYELGIPNAVLAAGSRTAQMHLMGVTNMAPLPIEIGLTADSDQHGLTVQTGTAQAGGASSITLSSGASATNDIYNYQRIDILSGPGAGESAVVIDYGGGDKVATVDHAWQVQPDSTSVYRVMHSRVPRDVSKVTGDLYGKVLGTTDGGGTISGAGVWAYDHTGVALVALSKFKKWLQLLFRKDSAIATDNATELSEINADGGSGVGSYSQATDSAEAIRDRGDAAWTTGGGSGLDAAGVRAAIGLASANLDTQIATLPTWTKLKKWLQLLFRKDTAIGTDNATELGEINASGGSGAGSYNQTTDSVEALRDRGDAAWTTGTALDAAGIRSAVGLASANLDTQIGTLPTWTKLKKWLQLLFRKDSAIATDNATELSEINADGGSGVGSYSQATDSAQAIRDRGDAAWTGAAALDEAGADPTATPGPTATFAEKLDWMFAKMKNAQTQTKTLQTVAAEDGTVISEAAVSSDGTTVTRGTFGDPV